MLTVACVLQIPNNNESFYDASWVQKLKRNVAIHLSQEHRFVCLTNTAIPNVDCIPLQNPSWDGWWSKIELFTPGHFDGPVLYLDLDLFAVSSLDELVRPRENMVMLKDYWEHIKNSSIMFWNGKDERMHSIFHKFLEDPEGSKEKHRETKSLGDQGFIKATLEEQGYTIDLWQDILDPEGFIPFSMARKINPELIEGEVPSNARLIYCLGSPKFHEFTNLKFIQEHWTL